MLAKLHSLSMILLLLFLGTAWAGDAPVAGKVVSLSGQVTAKNQATPNQQRYLKPGDAVTSGDWIQTDSQASIKLLMSDRTVFDLGPSSSFKLNEYQLRNGEDRTVETTLLQGRLRSAINTKVKNPGRFLIKTRAAVMGVRGTEFIIASDFAPASKENSKGNDPNSARELRTQVTVIQGTVDYTPQNTPQGSPQNLIQLTEGKQLTTTAPIAVDGRVIASTTPSTTVVNLPPTEMRAAIREAKVPDQTFRQAVVIDNITHTNNNAPGQGSGPAPGPRQVNTTLAAVDGAFTPPPQFQPPPPRPGDTGVPGASLPFFNPINRPVGNPVNIRVVFKK